MPEKDISTYQFLAAIGTALTMAVTFFIHVLGRENKKLAEIKVELEKIDKDVHEVETDLHEFREHVATYYPSHKAMQACSDNISRAITDGLKTQAAELKLAMRDVVKNDCPNCVSSGKKRG